MTGVEKLPVFVYGTLRRGQKNYPHYLQGKTLRERSATVSGHLYFVDDGGYPYLTSGMGRVFGEMMELLPEQYEEILRKLDELEEYDPRDEKHSVYLRRRTEAVLEHGERITVWAYYWNCPEISGRRIRSGDFTLQY
jgi:gamma-glutamylcyclotransferase (GGCT)/AIG2-like uncharacterized protein YtfP